MVYRGTTMEANKRDWNSVGKSSNLLQVREPGVPGSYPLQTSVASLATDEWSCGPLLLFPRPCLVVLK